jgi:hypothetical protein
MVSFISAGRCQLAIVPVSIIYNLSVVWVKKFKSCEAIIQRFFPEDVYLMIALCNIVYEDNERFCVGLSSISKVDSLISEMPIRRLHYIR